LPVSECLRLGRYAREDDDKDVRFLFLAIFGEKNREFAPEPGGPKFSMATKKDSDKKNLHLILSELNIITQTQKIAAPIDFARATYNISIVIINSSEEFFEIITSFYTHLMRRTLRLNTTCNPKEIEAEAVALLEKAFAKNGGFKAALEEARNGTKGGLRYVLDVMTDKFKWEEMEKHLNLVIKTAIDPLSDREKIDFIKEMMKCLDINLSPEEKEQPPERYAAHYEQLIRAILRSKEEVERLFRSI
jgi:hypothetical protein